MTGQFVSDPISQVFTNLIRNALRHGDSTAPIRITMGKADGIPRIRVHNSGKLITTEVMTGN
ncbi:ATP-binding protein [Pseudomonas shirazensis]|uniref:ATP-binding protein n=1 Tax=Pseudomonas shirazensis TaxID=2745494 RepID=UPI003BF4B710